MRIGKRPSVVEGKTYESVNYGSFKVVKYEGWESVLVEFEDGYRTVVQATSIRLGQVRNPFYPNVYGVGFIGEGLYLASFEGRSLVVYRVWSQILGRCFSETVQDKQPSYKGCTPAEGWKCFQNFAMWYYQNHVDGWVVDKDLLIPYNKVYGPEFCCFIPPEVNSFLTVRKKKRSRYKIGVSLEWRKFYATYSDPERRKKKKGFDTEEEASEFYLKQKEIRAKALAEKYKDGLSLAAYQALVNYDAKERYRET